MSKYVEGWQIRHPDGYHKTIIGIELLDEQRQKDMPGYRYRCWVGGCGIGRADTIPDARALIVDHMRDRARQRIRELEAEVQRQQQVLDTLQEGSHLFKLEAYDESAG